MLRRSPLRRRSGLRAVSPRRARQNKQYRILRAAFLHDRPWCEFPGCGKRASDVHHRRGRRGDLLCRVEFWTALCRCCHAFVTEQPAEAIRLGLSESRLT